MIHPHNRMLLFHSARDRAPTNTDGTQAFCYVNEFKLGYPLDDSVSMTFWERQNFNDRKQIPGCLGLAVVGGDDYKRNYIQLPTREFCGTGYVPPRDSAAGGN